MTIAPDSVTLRPNTTHGSLTSMALRWLASLAVVVMLAGACDLLSPASTADARMETPTGVARAHVDSEPAYLDSEVGADEGLPLLQENFVEIRGHPAVQVEQAPPGEDIGSPEIGDITFEAFTKPTPVWAGPYTPSSSHFAVRGLGVAYGLVLVADDATYTGIDGNILSVLGHFDGTYGDVTLSESRFAFHLTDEVNFFRLGGQMDDFPPRAIPPFLEDTCPQAVKDHVIAGSGTYDSDAKTIRFGDGPLMGCRVTATFDNGNIIYLCGSNVEGLVAEGCTWKLVLVSDPQAFQLVIAGFGACDGGERRTCNSWW